MPIKWKTYQDQFGLLLIWGFIIWIIGVNGDFPLNDDWCYGKSVKTLTEEGYLKLYNWGEMTLVGQIYWGYLFTHFFGFSFTVLRWSTLIMSAAAIIGTYELCRLIRCSRRLAILAALLSMLNPIFMVLSFSFMTDVPFYALTVWATYGLVKTYQTDRWGPMIFAIFLCCWAFLIRQLAMVLPLAWLLATLLSSKRNQVSPVKRWLPLLVVVLLYFAYTYGMKAMGLLQGRYNDKLGLLFDTITHPNAKLFINPIGYLLVILTYAGFFLAPLHLIRFPEIKRNSIRAAIIAYSIIAGAVLIISGKAIPSLDNVWIDFGVGPTTLFDHYGDFRSSPGPKAPQAMYWVITLIGLLSSAILIHRFYRMMVRARTQQKRNTVELLALFYIIIYLAPFLLVGIYDRYLLPLLPMIIILLLRKYKSFLALPYYYVSLGFAMMIGFFSVCATHDYLSWNRVRWQAIDECLAEGIPKEQLQGGAEYSCWYFFSEEKSNWWEDIDPEYALVFKPQEESSIVKSYPYARWLPGRGVIYLERIEP